MTSKRFDPLIDGFSLEDELKLRTIQYAYSFTDTIRNVLRRTNIWSFVVHVLPEDHPNVEGRNLCYT